jgi:hypothetical protein
MTTFTDTESQSLGIHDTVSFVARPGAVIAENIDLNDTTLLKYQPGAVVAENIDIHETIIASARFKEVLTEIIKLHPAAAPTILAAIQENLDINDVTVVTLAAFLAERLGIHDVMTGISNLKVTISEQLDMQAQVVWFLGGFLSDTLIFTEQLSPLWRYARTISENLDINDTVTPKLVMRITLADNVDVTDQTALQALYKASVMDNITISVAFVDPGGGFTTWAVNTRTGAVTEYQDFVYNSFAQMGHHFLGASAQGLYVLDGALDDTASIVARVKSGSAQFSGSHFTAFDAIYLGLRVSDTGSDWLLKLRAGDGREYVYAFRPLNRRTTKVFLGKGLRARYFSWELITAGEEFDLDAIEFVPIGSHRRT